MSFNCMHTQSYPLAVNTNGSILFLKTKNDLRDLTDHFLCIAPGLDFLQRCILQQPPNICVIFLKKVIKLEHINKKKDRKKKKQSEKSSLGSPKC